MIQKIVTEVLVITFYWGHRESKLDNGLKVVARTDSDLK